MDLLDRYVSEVVRRLPEKSRADVEMELRANIGDMLPKEPAAGDIVRVLKELGDPARLADEYRQAKRYLIGPELYDTYISVLRIVVPILMVVTVVSTVISGVSELPKAGIGIASSSAGLISKTIGALVDGAASAFTWVTVAFALVSRSGLDTARSPFKGREWSPDQLPPVAPSKRSRIPRLETIIKICLLAVWTAVICLTPQAIAAYVKDGGALAIASPLFVIDRLRAFVPGIIIFAFLDFCVLVMMLVTERWNIAIAVSNSVHKIGSAIFYCVMLGDASLFNPVFQRRIADIFNISYHQFADGWHSGVWVLQLVIVIGSVVDAVMGFSRSRP